MTDAISESELQDGVVQLARLLGYRVFHSRPARTSKGWRTPVQYDGKGFVDLVMVSASRKRVIFVELKRLGGRLSEDQQGWAQALNAAGAEYHSWTPADWPEHVTSVLSGLPVREVA